MQKEIHIDWPDLLLGCRAITEAFIDKNIKTVVGIARGGIIPAAIISRQLNTIFNTIAAKSYNDKTRGAVIVGSLPDCIEEGNILIIDEICDSGYTMSECKGLFADKYLRQNIYTATISYKENNVFKPDFYFSLHPADEWVIFPWE